MLSTLHYFVLFKNSDLLQQFEYILLRLAFVLEFSMRFEVNFRGYIFYHFAVEIQYVACIYIKRFSLKTASQF